MRALVMAAGLGTRLRPLTDQCPKPLVPVNGRPMITYVLELLAKYGVQEALINIHYLPEQLKKFVNDWNSAKKSPILSIQDESEILLGSGGALSKAAPWLWQNESYALICNSDVIAAPNIHELVKKHLSLSGVECTLAVMKNAQAGIKYNGVRIVGDFVKGFEQNGVHDEGLWFFPGFYILNKSTLLPPAGEVYSVVNKVWINQAKNNKLGAWVYSGPYFDLGSPEDIKAAEVGLQKLKEI